MDFNTFRERLATDDLRVLKSTDVKFDFLRKKYSDIEIIEAYKLSEKLSVVHFKQKLWDKLAFFKEDQWMETRINSLKNTLPEVVFTNLNKTLKKKVTIIKVESVITSEGNFYYYVIAKVSGKKKLLELSREGEIFANTKYVENVIKLSDPEAK